LLSDLFVTTWTTRYAQTAGGQKGIPMFGCPAPRGKINSIYTGEDDGKFNLEITEVRGGRRVEKMFTWSVITEGSET